MENSDYGLHAHVEAEKPRPVFLTVLCILSYIGNAFVIFGSLISFVWLGVFRTISEAALEQGQFPEELESVPFYPMVTRMFELFDYLPLISGVAIIAAVINIFGVYQMWQQKRSGFYIYSVTELAPYIMNLVIYTSVLGVLGFAMSMFNLVIPIAFVVMYGLNLKHMK